MAFFKTKQVPRGMQISVELPVAVIEEGDTFVAYTPALDLSSCGETKQEAIRMFNEAVRMFFNDIVENNTAEEVLAPLGWKRDPARSSWVPPKISQESVTLQVPAMA